MQSLATTSVPRLNGSSLVGGGTSYTAAQVLAQFTNPAALISYRFNRLNAAGDYLTDLTPSTLTNPAPSVDHDSSRAVKRTLSIALDSGTSFDVLTELIEVFFRLLAADGGWLEWSLGVFSTNQPQRKVHSRYTHRQLNASDLSYLLSDTTFPDSVSIPTGTYIDAAINQILSVVRAQGLATPFVNSISAAIALPATIGWNANTSALQAINDLLQAVGYTPLWVDRFTLKSYPLPDYSQAQSAFTFDTTLLSNLVGLTIDSTGDLSQAFNTVKVLVEHPAAPTFGVTYINNNSLSPTGTIRLKRSKAKVISDSTIVNQEAAYRRARWEAQRSAWYYATYRADTIPWPLSTDLDVYTLVYNTPDEGVISAAHLEVAWQHSCNPAAVTGHDVIRIVQA